jgi:putative flippase GtrA
MKSSCRDGRPRPSVPSEARQSVCRWLKFNAVGGIGIVVQLAALAVFRSWLKVDYLLATGLAVEIAVIHNFLWHERYTWADRPATRPMQSLVRLAKFNASNGAVSMLGNLGLMRLLVGELKFNYVVSNLIAIVVCSLVNFLLGDRFVFAAEGKQTAISSAISCQRSGSISLPDSPGYAEQTIEDHYSSPKNHHTAKNHNRETSVVSESREL